MSGEIYGETYGGMDDYSVINSIGSYRRDYCSILSKCLVELFIVSVVFGKQLDLFWLS